MRSFLFWAHLGAGAVAGVFILLMSATGVILTYERQMVAAAERSAAVSYADGQSQLSADELMRLAANDGETPSLLFANDPAAPVRAQIGRGEPILLNPYTGETLQTDAGELRAFFDWVTGLHRWLAMEGDGRDVGRGINDAANLVFLFIVVSGIYLWLPKVWNGATMRVRIMLGFQHPTAKARDYNWHHALALWTFIPLFFIVASGVVFSYPWANQALYAAFGEEAPARGGPRGGGPPGRSGDSEAAFEPPPGVFERILSDARSYNAAWRTISLGAPSGREVRVTVDTGTGGEPTKRHTLNYDAATGARTEVQTFASQSPGRQARSIARFLHTGEALGIVGQTIAGLASLAACFMVWTGLALAYRRLIAPLFIKAAKAEAKA